MAIPIVASEMVVQQAASEDISEVVFRISSFDSDGQMRTL